MAVVSSYRRSIPPLIDLTIEVNPGNQATPEQGHNLSSLRNPTSSPYIQRTSIILDEMDLNQHGLSLGGQFGSPLPSERSHSLAFGTVPVTKPSKRIRTLKGKYLHRSNKFPSSQGIAAHAESSSSVLSPHQGPLDAYVFRKDEPNPSRATSKHYAHALKQRILPIIEAEVEKYNDVLSESRRASIKKQIVEQRIPNFTKDIFLKNNNELTHEFEVSFKADTTRFVSLAVTQYLIDDLGETAATSKGPLQTYDPDSDELSRGMGRPKKRQKRSHDEPRKRLAPSATLKSELPTSPPSSSVGQITPHSQNRLSHGPKIFRSTKPVTSSPGKATPIPPSTSTRTTIPKRTHPDPLGIIIKNHASTIPSRRAQEAAEIPKPTPTVFNRGPLAPLPPLISQLIHDRDLSSLALALTNAPRPYLRITERAKISCALHKDSIKKEISGLCSSGIIHVDMTESELQLIFERTKALMGDIEPADGAVNSLSWLLKKFSKHGLKVLVDKLFSELGPARRRSDLAGFISDAKSGNISGSPAMIRLESSKPLPNTLVSKGVSKSVSKLLLDRVIGSRHIPGAWLTDSGISQEIESLAAESMGPWRHWKGASNDVLAVAWAPDGDNFAIGASALTDDQNMQYNRPNNLLVGSVSNNTLTSLPDHRLPRHQAEEGLNSTHAMMNVVDEWLYYTISSIKYSSSGATMYTSSFDKTVKVWDMADHAKPVLSHTLVHDDSVDMVSTSIHYPNIATGSKVTKNGIRVYNSDYSAYCPLSSNRAESYAQKSELKMHPSCLKWGIHSQVSRVILAGFSPEEAYPTLGDICLWELGAGKAINIGKYEAKKPKQNFAQNIFDCVWHPTLPYFATACNAVAPTTHQTTKTFVRIYEVANSSRRIQEFECPATDINEITFSTDEIYCTASCTDAVTYVWDTRWPEQILHKLKHGNALLELSHEGSREENDAGVTYVEWGKYSDRLYTGSSDGIVKTWDVRLAPEDVYIRDVAQLDAGVMSGSFSNDWSHILVGDACGGITLLTTDHPNPNPGRKDLESIKFSFEPEEEVLETISKDLATDLISSGQIEIDAEFGAGKGPRYSQWYANWAKLDENCHGEGKLKAVWLSKQKIPSGHLSFERRREQNLDNQMQRDMLQSLMLQDAINQDFDVPSGRRRIPQPIKVDPASTWDDSNLDYGDFLHWQSVLDAWLLWDLPSDKYKLVNTYPSLEDIHEIWKETNDV
ncbi:MAG: hypothetical protein M1829_000486 [Trizodia sp. TS-e1964]|nr:MAG: hypothetical protein M1829_000486 [Trizodia sp. TS-e1964]